MTVSTLGRATPNFPLPLDLRYLGGRRWKLIAPFAYVERDIRLDIPEDFVTDFNSIPRGLWNILPPTEYGEAGVIHDWVYQFPAGRSRSQCDDLHGRVLKLLGAPRWKRRAIRFGLRIGGWHAWRRHRLAEVSAVPEATR